METRHTSSRWTFVGAAAVAVLGLVATGPPVASAAGESSVAPALPTSKTVTNINNSGAGSLRAAIFKANNGGLAVDTILFNIPGGGRHIIAPLTDLPALTAPVTIDGYSQPGATPADPVNNANLKIVIDATGLSRGLELNTSNSLVSGLDIRDADTGAGDGIQIAGNGNTISGCYVGVNYRGDTAAGNVGDGISVNGSSNVVGGTTPAERNVISANGDEGVLVVGSGNSVEGNRIGTDASGVVDLGNAGDGVRVQSASNAVSGNLISGNTRSGIEVVADFASLMDNVIGANALGTSTLPNNGDGILVNANRASIGDAGSANTIVGNGGNGIEISGRGHFISANFIGTDAAGTLGFGNAMNGILLQGTRDVIGGITPDLGNVISGNGADGIRVSSGGGGHFADANLIEWNHVGIDATTTITIPNATNGVELRGTFNQTTNNTIWFNGAAGIVVMNGTANALVGNSLQDNVALGIDLFPLGVTPNDIDDPDAGANDLLNTPLVNMAVSNTMGTVVTWEVHRGLPNTTMQLEFFASDACDATGFGEGTTPLGTLITTTDASGNAMGTTQLSGTSVPGQVVAATATLTPPTTGPTSELSPCRAVS